MQARIFSILLVVFFISSGGAYCQKKGDPEFTADSLRKVKDYKGAVANYTIAINNSTEHNGKLAMLLNKRAAVKLKLNLFKEAAEDGTQALAIDPKLGIAYWNRGIAYAKMDSSTAAIQEYTLAMPYYEQAPEDLAILYSNRAWLNRRLGLYKESIDDYTKALLYNKDMTSVYFNRAVVYFLNKEYSLAIDDYTADILYQDHKDDSELAKVYYFRGHARVMLDKYNDAINDFNAALKLVPDYKDAYVERGDAYKYNGDYELSSTDYTTAMQFFKNDNKKLANLYKDRSDNARDMTQFEQAFKDLNMAIELDPSKGKWFWNRGILNTSIGECRAAIADYTKALEFYKNDTKILSIIHSGIATEYYVLKDDQKVIDECAIAIALRPTYASPYFTRAKVYLKRRNNKTAAIADFNKAIEVETDKTSTGYIFSQLYMGRTDIAKELLQKMILETPNQYDALHNYYNIACVYSILNEKDIANTYLKKAIESGYPKKFAANDEDFDNIRNTADYSAYMNANPSK